MNAEPLRAILHSDLDAFYASMEQRDNPALRGKPVIVGGDPQGRGVVATASYEARAFGVHSAQSCRQAIYRQYTPLVEPLALDEAYLDITSLVGEESPAAAQVARDIKQAIVEQTELSASIGVSCNKMLAKLASAHHKPDGLTVITPEAAPAFLDALPVGKIFGVGEVTEARFKELGITVGRELKQLSLERLQELFGKRGTDLYRFIRGEDDRPVEPERERKSVGKETTFERDLADRQEMLVVLEQLAQQVESRLVELEVAGKTVTLKLRWHDFQLVTRSLSIASPIQDAQAMMRSLRPLLDQLLMKNRPVRLLGVTLSHLVSSQELHKLEHLETPSLWELVLQRDFTSAVPATGPAVGGSGSNKQRSCGAADTPSTPMPQAHPTPAGAR
jgi:DNA polymerase IV